ncbi:DNA-3-methyladenine glycosylase family protein [Actinoplanes sp. NPDC051494]|uniref:DNA-3-methyladenine glycosylase family protein n=1 Tax=Actinoplanes sp. NPDC051494 TaxID=3363907 RepID=UPI003790E7D2
MDREVTPPVELRLTLRRPFLPDSLFGHLAATAVPGVEEWRGGAYRRTLRLRGGPAVVALTPHAGHVGCRLWLTDPADRDEAVALCRWLLDLDTDPAPIAATLGADPVLAPLLAAAPGRRMPRCPDGAELALRTVLGQQISTAAARTHAGRLVASHGTPVADPGGGLTHLFPVAGRLADVDPDSLALPHARRATFRTLARALADGDVDLDRHADRDTARARLAALPGIGPWTIETVAMRAFGDPDAFLPGDLGVRVAAGTLGLPATPGALTRRAEVWRPWRAYAVLYLWGSGTHAVNFLPPAGPAGNTPPARRRRGG